MLPMKMLWPGFNAQGSVIIPLEMSSFPVSPDAIVLSGERFEPKEELHVTLISKKTGITIQGKMITRPEIESGLAQKFDEIDWAYEKTGPVHLLSRAREYSDEEGELKARIEKTIIMRLKMPGIAMFYDYLKSRDLLDSDCPAPPPHVTLFTRNCPVGIGLPDLERLEALTCRTFPIVAFNDLCANQV